nr:hypothetical protein [Tanacetum cinerariifolium]
MDEGEVAFERTSEDTKEMATVLASMDAATVLVGEIAVPTEIEAKFVVVWKLVKDFIPMGSKEEAERLKRNGFNLEQEKAKKQNTSEEVHDKEKSLEEILEEKVKEMMQLILIEEVY